MADPDSSVDSTTSVDKPNEVANTSQQNEVNSEKEEVICGIKPSQICGPKPVLTSPKLRCFGGSSLEKNPSSSLLRPPQLGAPKQPFALNPSRLNPFARTQLDEEKQNGSGLNGDSPKFLPLVQTGGKTEERPLASTSSTPIPTNCGFVFGENIRDRVVAESKPEEARTSLSISATSNGSSDMLFTSALKEAPPSTPAKEAKSLSESAREYEESRASKRKYEEVEVKTGEEGETNVIQITCKLFAYDNGNWQERGRGVLRLNDRKGNEDQQAHSRLVFRTAGSLRVVLNTKIWAKMSIQQASPKSIRLTAFDSNGDVKVFLATGQPDEMKQLYKHLDTRVHTEIAKLEEPSPKKTATD